uniref:Peptidase S1 domain-containing protein n=1 Tax=Panagrellus redivivus TaxID=6233 RepID=A0A7E4VWI1_PANRE
MPKPSTSPLTINKSDVQINTDRFCTQLTYSIEPYTPGDVSNSKCQYEIYNHCEGTKIVNVKCGPDTYKCHDGCLRKISYRLGKIAEHTNEITIESRFDPVIVKKALTYIFNPKKFQVDLLSSKEKYDMVLFGAYYYFPARPLENLIDRQIYPDLVQYAWNNCGDLGLMGILPKIRIPGINFVEDFKNVDEKIMVQFVKKYIEHEIDMKNFRRYKIIACIVAVCVLLFALIAMCYYA